MRIERNNPNPKMPMVRYMGGTWRVGGLLALSRAFGDAYLKGEGWGRQWEGDWGECEEGRGTEAEGGPGREPAWSLLAWLPRQIRAPLGLRWRKAAPARRPPSPSRCSPPPPCPARLAAV